MAWKLTLEGGAEMTASDQVRTPGGLAAVSSIEVGDLVCIFPDGHMPVEVTDVEEV